MANFNLTESAVANANHSGNSGNKRKVCNYCQRTFHRNSLIRHQKICVSKSPDSRRPLKVGKEKYEHRDSCFKENDIHSDDCRFGQDGDPPKLQIFSDGSNTSAECEYPSDTVCNEPPTLQSVGEEMPDLEVRVTRLMRMNSVMSGNGYHRGTRTSSEEESQLNGKSCKVRVTEDTTKLLPVQQSLSGIAAKIISTNGSHPESAIQGSHEPKPRKPELGKGKGGLKTYAVPPSKRPLPGGKSTSQCKKQKQDSPLATHSSASNAKTVVVLAVNAVDLKCEKCLLTFESQESLHSHGITHIQNGTLVCLLCSNKQVDNLDVHFKEDHQTEKKKVMCDLCGITMDRNCHFYHFKEHHSLVKKFKCNLCSKEFSFMQSLLLHKSNDHLKEMYNSKYCQRNGDMMNVSDGGGCGSSSSSCSSNHDKDKNTGESSSFSSKSRYVRRYGAPPRNSSSENKCNGNGFVRNLSCKLNGASVASLNTEGESGSNENLLSVCRRSSIESSDSENNQPNSNGFAIDGPGSFNGCSADSSCDSIVNKSDSDPQNSNAKNNKTVNICSKTGETTTALTADSSCHPDSPDPDQVVSSDLQQDVCTEYTCRLCTVKFESRFKYLRHLKNAHHWTRDQLLDPEYEPEFWCPECGQEFVVRPTLVKHLIIAHEDVVDIDDYLERVGYGSRPLIQFQCSVCLIVFESEQELSFHLRCHGLAYLQYLTSNSRFC